MFGDDDDKPTALSQLNSLFGVWRCNSDRIVGKKGRTFELLTLNSGNGPEEHKLEDTTSGVDMKDFGPLCDEQGGCVSMAS